MRIAVIGGTASGPAAAAEVLRARPDADVVLYEEGAHISVGACEIPYFVAGQLGGAADLEVLTPEAFERTRGGTVRTNHRVVSIDPGTGELAVEAGVYGSRHTERFDRFILAMGARARSLGVPGEEAAGVFSIRGYPDALALKKWLDTEPVRHVVVAGGGYVGLEMAQAMRDRGLRATILEPRGRVLPHAVPAALASPLDAAVRGAGVAVRSERVVSVRADRFGRVESVTTDRGERIGCQALLVAIGVEPRTELARAAGLAVGASGALAVDDTMQTSHRAVWACGDLVEVPRAPDGARVHWPLAPVGRRTARVAARNAGGARPPDRLAPIAGAVAVRAFAMEAAAVGVSLEEAQAAGLDAGAATVHHWTRTRMYPGSRPIGVRLVVERGGRLLGGAIVSPEGAALRADTLVPLIQSGAPVRVLAEDMDLVYNPPVAPSVDPLKVAAADALRVLGRRRQTRSSRP